MYSNDLQLVPPPAGVRGCLSGGAVGDALGAAVEFLTLEAIRERFGPGGIRDYAGERGAFTDDTQMTLFTAEGLLLAQTADAELPSRAAIIAVWEAYQRWHVTQQPEGHPEPLKATYGAGWLFAQPLLHRVEAPGATCLSALASGKLGVLQRPQLPDDEPAYGGGRTLNDSKGCGGVMRAAPAGLLRLGVRRAFRLGCDVAALTHGHPSGYLAAGVLAAVVDRLLTGVLLDGAISAALGELRRWPHHAEVLAAVERAVELAGTGPATSERVERLGAGWVAEEALAIACFCALVAGDDFEAGVLAAVNHSGDSDSTGALTGNLLGALLGDDAVADHWCDRLEGRLVLDRMAVELCRRRR